MSPAIPWPDGRRAALAVTFDVDAEEGPLADDPANAERPATLSQAAFGVRFAMPPILDLLDRHGVRATFFVPGRTAARYPGLVPEIVGRGHEPAAHGASHRPPATLSAEEEAREFEEAVRLLRGFGAELAGYRAPAWDLSPRTLSLAAAHGFTYSSNLMDDVHPYLHPDTDLVELPVSWTLDDAPHFWFDADDWTRKMATPSEVREIWDGELRGIREAGGLCVLTMHPEVIGRPGRLAMLDAFLAWATTLDGLWTAPCAEVATWARSRLSEGLG